MNNFTPDDTFRHATQLFETRFKGATFCVAAGSIIEGYGTRYSDLDLIVVFPKIDAAFRESFMIGALPVEAFVHDYETMQMFMDDDLADGRACMQNMLAAGRFIPSNNAIGEKLKLYATRAVQSGPGKTGLEKIAALRYAATDLIDDLKGERPPAEVRAILYSLYQILGELRLRSANQFLGSGKRLARKLQALDPRFLETTEAVLAKAHVGTIDATDISSLELMLAPFGGRLFDGYKQVAPSDKRKAAEWLSQNLIL